jgi:hypothetical protein
MILYSNIEVFRTNNILIVSTAVQTCTCTHSHTYTDVRTHDTVITLYRGTPPLTKSLKYYHKLVKALLQDRI